MLSHSAAVLFALATMVTAIDKEVASLSRDSLAVGQRFEIRCADRLCRGQVVDRASGQCQMEFSFDGQAFTAPRTVYLLGATAGPQERQMLVLMHQVKVGLKLELGLDDLEQRNRLVTGEVTAIRLVD